MDSEKIATNHVELAISKADHLVSHINSNDKEPSWDGDVEVYKKSGHVHAKADLILKVPVQVKGHIKPNLKKKSIKYSIQYSDLRNYLYVGGTIFFVVYFDEEDEHHTIYYVGLLPFDLKKMLKDHKGDLSKSTHFVMLNKDAMLKYCNIDYNALLDAVQHVPFSEDYSHSLNALLLEMLKAYDESKNSRIELLSTATALALWIKDSDPYTEHPIAILNYLQSVKRSRTLTSTEQAEILSLIEATQDNESIYVGAYLLLDNPVAAKIHFDKLPEESQKFFESCPIYHFMPNGQPTVSALTEG